MCIAAALTIILYSALAYKTAIEAGLTFWLMSLWPMEPPDIQRLNIVGFVWFRLVSNGFRHIVYVLGSNTRTHARSQFESRIRWCTNGTGSSNKWILFDHFINIKMCFASFLVLCFVSVGIWFAACTSVSLGTSYAHVRTQLPQSASHIERFDLCSRNRVLRSISSYRLSLPVGQRAHDHDDNNNTHNLCTTKYLINILMLMFIVTRWLLISAFPLMDALSAH